MFLIINENKNLDRHRKSEKKKYFYRVIEKYENVRLTAELTEFKSPPFDQDEDEITRSQSNEKNNEQDSSEMDQIYLLSLNINKKETNNVESSILKKSFDAKYLFLCPKLIFIFITCVISYSYNISFIKD